MRVFNLQQLVSFWLALDGQRRAIVLISTIAMFAAVLTLSSLANAPSMSLLYSGLEPGTSGDVVKSLEQRAVQFEIRGNSIFVDSARRDELRMTLASEGLPTLSGQGYELLDNLSGFGTTAQMFDAAYWRAKEGELARTIVANSQFRSARVHISNSVAKAFRRSENASASVTVTSVSDGISSANAIAIRHLVASAISGMSPKNVSIVDGRNGIIVADDLPGSSSTNGGNRAEELKQNVQNLLEARVGVGNAIVEVYVENVTESEAITERRFDPEGRVAISSETEESSTTSKDARGGSVTVASNLPEGDAAGGDNSSSSQNSETRERTNFEVSETTREVLRTPGAVRRISTAVLVNGLTQIDPATNEETWGPRSEDEMTALEDLVASAVGLDTERGDTLTMKMMQFEAVVAAGTTAEASATSGLNLDVMRLIQVAVLALVSLVLGLFVIRPILTKAPARALPAPVAPSQIDSAGALNQSVPAADSFAATPAGALTGEVAGLDKPQGAFDSAKGLPAIGSPLQIDSGATLDADAISDPVERLRQMIENRQEETVEILKSWIEDGEETV